MVRFSARANAILTPLRWVSCRRAYITPPFGPQTSHYTMAVKRDQETKIDIHMAGAVALQGLPDRGREFGPRLG